MVYRSYFIPSVSCNFMDSRLILSLLPLFIALHGLFAFFLLLCCCRIEVRPLVSNLLHLTQTHIFPTSQLASDLRRIARDVNRPQIDSFLGSLASDIIGQCLTHFLRRWQKSTPKNTTCGPPHDAPRHPPRLGWPRFMSKQSRNGPVHERKRREHTQRNLRVRCKDKDRGHYQCV